MSGTTQNITVNSEPDGAECTIVRQNVVLHKVTTPDTIEIDKTKHDLSIKCELSGYFPETVSIDSEIQGSTWGNIILSGGIGWAIDSARGADNKYADTVMFRLTPVDAERPTVTVETGEEAPPAEGMETETGVPAAERNSPDSNQSDCC